MQVLADLMSEENVERISWYILQLSVDLALSPIFLFATSCLKHSHTSVKALDADGGEEETFGAEREGKKSKKRNG